jgi:hypothetical protein
MGDINVSRHSRKERANIRTEKLQISNLKIVPRYPITQNATGGMITSMVPQSLSEEKQAALKFREECAECPPHSSLVWISRDGKINSMKTSEVGLALYL